MKKLKIIVYSVAVGWATISSYANSIELIVIKDAGGEALDKYVPKKQQVQASVSQKLADMDEIITQAQNEEGVTKKELQQRASSILFPLHTPELSSGKMAADIERPDKSVKTPMAIVGVDIRSKTWLRDNYHVLKRLKATIVVIEADSMDDIKRYKDMYRDVNIVIRNGSILASKFGLPCYPALITNQGIYQ